MDSRRLRRKHLSMQQQIEFIHDDLDEGSRQFMGLRREIRALMAGIVIAIVATGIWL